MKQSNKKNAIITAINADTEPFFLKHWLPSLLQTNDTHNLDIIILSYGISPDAIRIMKQNGCIYVPCTQNGHVVNIRLRDASRFLAQHRHTYNQVMHIDGGDIIFQADISPVFSMHPASVRIASQHMPIHILYLITRASFDTRMYPLLFRTVYGKPVLNAGVIVAPTDKFISLFSEAYSLIINTTRFLPDQMAINYVLYRDGYTLLPDRYNYMKTFSLLPVQVRHGTVYARGVSRVPIVHNCGWKQILRPFKRFGYGPECNIPNQPVYAYTELRRVFISTLHTLLPHLRTNSSASVI